MIQSMTAFATVTRSFANYRFTWELRAVNHRYLDVNLRLPEEWRVLDPKLRSRLQTALVRGKVECNLKIALDETADAPMQINERKLQEFAKLVESCQTYFPQGKIDFTRILMWPNILVNPAEQQLPEEELLIGFDEVVEELTATRQREGEVLAQVLHDKLMQIQQIVTQVRSYMPEIFSEQRNKLTRRLAEIAVEIDQNRLEQELVYFAQKIDNAEELDRLVAHTDAALHLLTQNGAVGKQLDFLMQEFNREANTLSSKSNNLQITQAALELKVLIEQMREQIQNIV